jgi:hypothetical protein
MPDTPTGASSAIASSGASWLDDEAPGSITPSVGAETESPGEPSRTLIDVLSGSSLNTFLRCARQWEYAYVFRLKRPPNLKMVVGTAGHKAAEVNLRAKLETLEDLPEDEVLDAYSDSYDVESVDAIEEPDKGMTKGSMKDTGIASVKFWRKEVAPPIQPMLVEQPFSFDIDGIPYTGTFDLAELDNSVWDHKFTNKTPSSAEAYILNMVGYAIGFRVATGIVEKQVILNNVVALKKGPKQARFRSPGPVPDESIRAFAGIVRDANRSIQAGIFPPTGIKSGACSWCGYRDICPAYKESPMGPREDADGTP